MIDTIRLEIKGLSPRDVEKVASRLESHLIVDNLNGSVRSEITRGTLLGSWDSRISVQIRDYEYQVYRTEVSKFIGKLEISDHKNSKVLPVKVKC